MVQEQMKTRNATVKTVRKNALTSGTVQMILDNAGVGLFNVDLQTGESVVSETWKTMIGMDPRSSKPAQEEWLKRVHPDDLQAVQDADMDLLSGKASKSKTVFRFRHLEDRWIWIQSDAGIVEWTGSGEPARLAGTHTDVTAEMVAKEIAEIRNSEQQLILEKSPAATAMFSVDGHLIYCNQVFCDFVGYEFSELEGMPYYRLAKIGNDATVVKRLLELQANQREEFEFECKFRCKNGTYRTGLVSACRTEDHSGFSKLLFQSIDISERVELEQQKDHFLSTVSHELRTPLTTIVGALKMLDSGSLGEMSGGMNRVVKLAQKSGDRMMTLVSDLLDLQALQAGEVVYDLQAIECDALLEEIQRKGEPLLRTEQRLQLDTGEGAELRVSADARRVVQILDNLVSNAIKFSPPAGKITLSAYQEGQEIVLEVSDEGIGIPEEQRDRIFDRFKQVNSSDTRAEQGIGLGLTICKMLVEAMNGSIGFRGREKGGTTFWVRLPAVLRDAA